MSEQVDQVNVEENNNEEILGEETDLGAEMPDVLGNIKINSEVIATISGLACTEVEGVAGMSGGITGEIANMLGKKTLSKGVKVQVAEKKTVIDLFIIVNFGVRIPDVAWKCQDSVKKAVAEYCGFESVEVNVHVQGIDIKETEKPQ